jgi:hypothetical protein
MRRIEIAFLAAVTLFGLFFVRITLDHADRALSRIVAADEIPRGSAGQPRDVDLDVIRRQIRRGRLSDHEARYYRTEPFDGVVEEASSSENSKPSSPTTSSPP